MIQVQTGVRAEAVRQSAEHVLFVEGEDDNSFDRVVLRTLFQEKIEVRPLGSSFHIGSVAEALYKHHPNYYFLIDRDHYDDARVEMSWKNFPDPQTNNLLVWRRRELENYFLIPDYISKSQYWSVSLEKLQQTIKRKAQERLYLDAANQVIVSIRETLKEKWVDLFTDTNQFQTKERALELLQNRSEYESFKKKSSRLLNKKKLTEQFEINLYQLTNGKIPLQFGEGFWLERLCGKEIFHTVANQCFKVKDREGQTLRGKIKENEIVKDLLRLPQTDQPADFQELYDLITRRILSSLAR